MKPIITRISWPKIKGRTKESYGSLNFDDRLRAETSKPFQMSANKRRYIETREDIERFVDKHLAGLAAYDGTRLNSDL